MLFPCSAKDNELFESAFACISKGGTLFMQEVVFLLWWRVVPPASANNRYNDGIGFGDGGDERIHAANKRVSIKNGSVDQWICIPVICCEGTTDFLVTGRPGYNVWQFLSTCFPHHPLSLFCPINDHRWPLAYWYSVVFIWGVQTLKFVHEMRKHTIHPTLQSWCTVAPW